MLAAKWRFQSNVHVGDGAAKLVVEPNLATVTDVGVSNGFEWSTVIKLDRNRTVLIFIQFHVFDENPQNIHRTRETRTNQKLI